MVLAKNIAVIGKIEESAKLIAGMGNIAHRMTAYLYSASNVYDHQSGTSAFIFLDSTFAGIKDFDPEVVPPWLDYRGRAVSLLNKIGGDKFLDIATEVYREIPEVRKFAATERMIKGIAATGNYNAAHS